MNTMDVSLLGGRRLSYSTAEIPALRHLSAMFSRNDINGTTITVVPGSLVLAVYIAGTIKTILLPPSVPITTNTGLRPLITALIAYSCTPLNSASCWPATWRNIYNRSTILTRFYRLNCVSIASAVTAAGRFLRNCYNVDACSWK
ncbi:uncharacterized protein K452DRAFT_346712 [Aplosporella prunicola CBS 121167]|uniref:Uncharacterized protein n=1 Tax=Aplosporella prunicola CBS 121167 TaxID=1176127 RepID=A0A6A6AVT1_9PEZI|nr:uncharacterized protein K452DRAFT_346712 [Aplosporella prunicola CBS 121167]KAF2135706.1 hypothetical protein K452DRAFT_346712 [Aplosporella prunicola CBS 121167]